MKWYRKLYVSESIGDKAGRIKWKINHNAGTVSVYVIAFASNPDNLLDIIPAWQLMQKSYPKKNLKIIEETYQHTGDVDVWSYLKEERRRRA